MKIYASVPAVITRDTKLQNKDKSFAKEQAVLLHIEGRLAPLETSVLLNGGAQPHEVGSYSVDPSSFGSGNYGSVTFRLRLGAKLQAPAVSKAA